MDEENTRDLKIKVENQQQQQQQQGENLINYTSSALTGNDENNRGTLRRVLSTVGHIKRYSWRRLSTNRSENFLSTDLLSHDEAQEEEEAPIHYSHMDVDGSENSHNEVPTEDTPFLQLFIRSKGPPQIVFLSMLYALALGSTVGVVPSVLTDRYAVMNHGFDSNDGTNSSCADYDRSHKPQACIDGSSDAQTAAALASFVSNTATFLTSSLIGSFSDEYGRRKFLILGQFLSCMSPICLVFLQVFTTMNPGWYYAASASTGFINWISIALSSLSDVMPKQWRAPTFGLLLSGFSLGFALSPILAIFCSHFTVSILSMFLLIFGFLYSVFFLHETLPPEQGEEARMQRRHYRQNESESTLHCISRGILRPFKELSILNRNYIFRLLSVLAFFSGMSTSADQTLLLYYVEDRLDFNDHDVAILFGMIGVIGILVQGVLLKQFTDLVGERFVVVIAFICGSVTNVLYAFAPTKKFIFAAVVVSSFTGMSFPTISAIKSNNAQESEQGRIQGALYALSSLANAVGKLQFNLVSRT